MTRTGRGRKAGAASKYRTMALEEIKALPVAELASKDALLFMWTTVPLLSGGLEVLPAWGFRYVSALVWRKTGRMGMGFWFRVDCELLLFGVRGTVKALRMQESNFFQCRGGRHSQKPDYYRQLVTRAAEKAFSAPRKLELFARGTRDLFPSYGMEGSIEWPEARPNEE